MEDKIKIPSRCYQHWDGDGIHPQMIPHIKSNILYHLRAATASGTHVLAGCYFYDQNEKGDDVLWQTRKSIRTFRTVTERSANSPGTGETRTLYIHQLQNSQ